MHDLLWAAARSDEPTRPHQGQLDALYLWVFCRGGALGNHRVAGGGVGGEGRGPPGFVYIIILSLFLAFNTFSVNMVLQYKRVGKWQSYVYGEKAYIVLSLVAKSLLAWQVFANILIPD
jgi:hypothetical protein